MAEVIYQGRINGRWGREVVNLEERKLLRLLYGTR